MCGKWGDHYRAGHPSAEEGKVDDGNDGDGHVAIVEDEVENEEAPPSGAFARLHAAGLI